MRLLFLLLGLSFAVPASAFQLEEFDLAVRDALVWEEQNQHIADTISDLTVAASVAAPFAYSLSREDRWRRTAFVAGATGLSFGLNQLVKHLVGRERPNGEDDKSFYSGHTSAAFTGINLLTAQTGWGALGYTFAFATAYFRVAADKHWASDVGFAVLPATAIGLSVRLFI